MITKEILNEFNELTNFDVISYYQNFVNFMETDVPYIIDYFSGNTKIVASDSFNNLNILLKFNDEALSLFTQSKNKLNNLKWVDLMIQLEDIDSTLLTVKNISKWLRSAKLNTGFNSDTEVQIGLNQYQTLENFNKDVLRNKNFQDSWINTAVRNNLTEEDYSLEGGNLLSVSFAQSGFLNIQAVVDNINSTNLLGKDIDKKLQFIDNDLKALNYADTFKQSILILSSLKIGDNPYLPDLGIDKKNSLGVNIALIKLPILFRQLVASFETDDTIVNLTIEDVVRSQDGIFVTFAVKSILGETEVFKTNLNN